MSRAEATSAGPAERLMVEGGAELAGFLEAVESQLLEAVRGYGPVLDEAATAMLRAGGKRLRPLLVFLCADGLGGEGLVRAAAAVELAHTASLVHDDVVDDAALRRGLPTVVAGQGRRAALASGDLLFARCFGLLVEGERMDEVRELSQACLDLARGELVQRQDARDPTVTVERYLGRSELKTGRLFEAACVLGAIEGSRPEPTERALAEFGRRIGLAFQILDDVLDVEGDPARTGKPRGTDLREGAVTLPLILASEERPRLMAEALAARSDADIAEICARILATAAVERSRERALLLVAQAKARIASSVEPGTRRRLDLVADGVVERYA